MPPCARTVLTYVLHALEAKAGSDLLWRSVSRARGAAYCAGGPWLLRPWEEASSDARDDWGRNSVSTDLSTPSYSAHMILRHVRARPGSAFNRMSPGVRKTRRECGDHF